MTDEPTERNGLDASTADADDAGLEDNRPHDRLESNEETTTDEETPHPADLPQSVPDVLQQTPGPISKAAIILYRLVGGLLSTVLTWVPKSTGLGYALFYTGLRMIRDNSRKADGVTFMFYGDNKVIPWPSRWVSSETKYKTSNGEDLSAKAEGHRPYQAGGVDVTFGLRGSAQVFEPIQAFVAMKNDAGEWIQSKRPDGTTDVFFDDTPPGRGDADGTILSWEKAFEQFGQKITSEDLDEQHRIGYLEALEEDIGTKLALYCLLSFIGGLAACLVMLYIISRVFGGGSGGIQILSGFMALPLEVLL